MNESFPDLSINQSAPSANRSPFWPVFITVLLITVILSTAVTFILPESYASTARIKVEPEKSFGTNGAAVYDPYFIQTTFEIIQSQLVLDRVIEKLNLNVAWGRKYFNGETLKSAESLQILKARISLAPVRGTKLIAITAYSDDRQEAAQVANAIAEAYRNYRETKVRMEEANKPVVDPRVIADAMVVITDRAEPGRYPVKPNKPLNLALGVIAGVVFGAIAGKISVWWRALATSRARAAAGRKS